MNSLMPARVVAGVCAVVFAATPLMAADVEIEGLPEKIAFGSCYRNGKNPEIWKTIAETSPAAFLFLGDNVYADTADMAEMRAEYQQLLDEPNYAKFSKERPVIAIWDDHDYGENDAGAEFKAKDGAKLEFMRAFGVAEDHPMRTRGGVYHSVLFTDGEKKVQVILLDTRFFRSPLKSEMRGRMKAYLPDADPKKTILGDEQWAWLKKELKEPADLRLVCSSIQVIADYHPFEKWANFPHERERLLEELGEASGKVMMLSGDRHMGEVAVVGDVMEVTSSGLTNAGGGRKASVHEARIGNRVGKRNFGLLEIDWKKEGAPTVRPRLLGADGKDLWAAEEE